MTEEEIQQKVADMERVERSLELLIGRVRDIANVLAKTAASFRGLGVDIEELRAEAKRIRVEIAPSADLLSRLPVRVHQALNRSGIKTFADLRRFEAMGRLDRWAIRGVGQRGYEEIQKLLQSATVTD